MIKTTSLQRGVALSGPRRRICACRARTLFQTDPPRGAVTLLDVEDAVTACSVCRDNSSRRECFEVFGVDAGKVDVYYHYTKRMEQHITKSCAVREPLDFELLYNGVVS